MIFLCTPINPSDFSAPFVVFITIFVIYFPLVDNFLRKASNLEKKGEIGENVVKILKKEYFWLWSLLGIFFLAAPTCFPFFIFFIMLLAFPVYFTFNFIFYFLNKKDYNIKERNLLLSFYGIPTLFILIIGVLYKVILYSKYYGKSALQEIYYYYILDFGKQWFIKIFIFLVLIFIGVYFYIYYIERFRKDNN